MRTTPPTWSCTRSVLDACLQIVLVILGSWAVGIYSAVLIFGKKEKEVPPV